MEENIASKNEQAASAQEERPGQDFDALLREREFRSEFDRRVSRALETARSKWAQETERKLERVRAETEALARMCGEERMAHDFAKREAALHERECAIVRRELRAEAVNALVERALPPELADALNYESAEKLEESLDAAERAFRSAVQSGVEKRMRGQAPAAARTNRGGELSDTEYYRTHLGAK